MRRCAHQHSACMHGSLCSSEEPWECAADGDPCCALQILCMHGGLPPELKSLEQVKRIPRPTDVPDTGLLCDLLWADPDKEVKGWGENDRGVSYTFGPDSVLQFLAKHDLDLICRAHQASLVQHSDCSHSAHESSCTCAQFLCPRYPQACP